MKTIEKMLRKKDKYSTIKIEKMFSKKKMLRKK